MLLKEESFTCLCVVPHFQEVLKYALLSDSALLAIIEGKTPHIPADGDQAEGSEIVGAHKRQKRPKSEA